MTSLCCLVLDGEPVKLDLGRHQHNGLPVKVIAMAVASNIQRWTFQEPSYEVWPVSLDPVVKVLHCCVVELDYLHW